MSHTRIGTGLALAALAVALGVALIGCSSDSATPGATTKPAAIASAHPPKGGAELWAQTCGQCHNLRSPSEFNGSEWQVIVYQMRLRAGLTGDQQKTITDFLKSATR